MKTGLIITALLFSTSSLASTGLDPAKTEYGFDAWPEDASLRQGLDLGSVDLSPYVEHSRRNHLSTSGEMIVRYREANGTSPALEIAIMVQDSVSGAQEHLLSVLSASTIHLPRAGDLGLCVGDVSFASGNVVIDTVLFTRANVYVRVTRIGSGPDIAAIASRIDARILSEKKAKSAKQLAKPRIEKLSAPSSALPGQAVPIALEVTDPSGSEVDLLFDEGGAMVYREDGRWYFYAEMPLDYTVTLYALNDHFLVSKRSFSVKVIP